MAGEHLDICSGETTGRRARKGDGARRFLGIRFACCDVYARVYLNRGATAYEGHCPKCSRPVRFRIGPGGFDGRFFTVMPQ